LRPDGIIAIGSKSGITQLSDSEPELQAVAPGRSRRSVSSTEGPPIRSTAPSAPSSGSADRARSAKPSPSSTTAAAPSSVSRRAFASLRVVAITRRPAARPSWRQARPTEDVPPRSSSVSPASRSSCSSEPAAVTNVSGNAPSMSHGSVVSSAISWCSGTSAYSA
jgi:hypothetical protein